MPIFIMPKCVFATETNKGIKGDLNNNKVVDIGDILIMLRHMAATSNQELDRSWVLTEEKIKQGDINKNNQIDINDVLLVLRYIAANNNEEIRAKHPEWLELEDEPKTVEVTSITLNKKSATIEEGQTLTLTAKIMPSNSTNKTLTWTSSNNEVATVKDGKITAKKAGTATITVKTNNGKEDKCKLTVKKKVDTPEPPQTVEVTSITLNRKNIDIVKTKKSNIESNNKTRK